MRGRGQCGDAKRLPAMCDSAEDTGVPVAGRQFVRQPIPRLDLAWRAAGGGGGGEGREEKIRGRRENLHVGPTCKLTVKQTDCLRVGPTCHKTV